MNKNAQDIKEILRELKGATDAWLEEAEKLYNQVAKVNRELKKDLHGAVGLEDDLEEWTKQHMPAFYSFGDKDGRD